MHLDPYELSRAFVLDPAYSRDECVPPRRGLSLWSQKTDGAAWLYTPGSLEAWLFQRTRHEAFEACLNISHPGRYRTPDPTLYARRHVDLAAVPPTLPCTVYWNGLLHLVVNGRTVTHTATTAVPARLDLDLAPYLNAQRNTIRARVFALEGPPTLWLESAAVCTDGEWEVSRDASLWQAARCMPFEGAARFPHQETLPELPVELTRLDDGTLDAGVEIVGRPVIRAAGEGAVAVHAGESREEVHDARDTVREQIVPVMRAGGVQPCKTDAALAFRYLRLACEPGVRIRDAHALAACYPTQYRGAFACSDDRLTAIWMHAAYTLRACMQLVFVDGLKRDRLPWVGDLYVCSLTNYHVFLERPASEYSLAALMGQDPDEVDLNGTVTYSLFWVMAVRDCALYSDASVFLKDLLPYLDRLLAAMGAKADSSGLLPTERFKWVYVDWADVKTQGYSAFLNCLYVMALEAAAEVQRAFGNDGKAQAYTRQAETVRCVCRRTFHNEDLGVFVDHVEAGVQGTHVSRQVNALAILSGVCEADWRRDIVGRVLLNPEVAPVGTPYMLFFEARALAACGETDAMLSLIRTYWGSMLGAGATTFWEAHQVAQEGAARYAFYGRPYGKSLCHAWSSGPLYLLSAELFGLRPLMCGWQEFTVNPAVSGLAWFCMETPTPHGPIRIRIAGQHVTVSFPGGTRLVLGAAGTEQRYDGPATLAFERIPGEPNRPGAWRCLGQVTDAPEQLR